MKKRYFFRPVLIAGLLLFVGCGMPSAKKPSAEAGSYITMSDAKTTVLENAGLLEENVVFVRLLLDSDGDVAKYDIEFVSETAEYTYTVNAVTGEILSLNCEAGHFDLSKIPTEHTPSGSTQANDALTGSSPENTQKDTLQDSQANTQTDSAQSGSQSGTQADGSRTEGSPNESDIQYIGRDAASQAALSHAGFDADSVRISHVRLEFDDGCWQYDVEFYKDNTEYNYDIDALTGAILSCSHDTDYHNRHHDSAGTPDTAMLTEDTAIQIALDYAGIAEQDTAFLTAELAYDDGCAEYEVEWYVGRTEYECDVDAYTGEVLSFQKELD